MTSVQIGKRDFADNLPLVLPGLSLQPQSYRHSAVGGPKEALLTAEGSPADLWGMVGTLRCPVEIRNNAGDVVWWGYVATVEIPYAGGVMRYSLDEMFNRLKVDYTHEYGDSQRLRDTTGWSTYSSTVDPRGYGRKDLIISKPLSDATAAGYERTQELTRLQVPQKEFRPGSSGARVLCAPWWDTVGWRLYEVDSLARASYSDVSGSDVQKGWPGGDHIAVSFTVPAATTCRLIGAYMRRTQDDPGTGGIRAELLTGASIGSASSMETSDLLGGISVPTEFGWVYWLLDSQQSLSAATTYWIDWDTKQGGAFFSEWRVDEGLGYTGGALQVKPSGGSYGSRSPDADLPFIVTDYDDSATLIGEIAQAMSEFVDSYTVVDASGIDMSYNREEDNSPLDDIAGIIKRGTTNQRRLLPEIMSDRSCRVREEPAAGSADYLWHADGTLADDKDNVVNTSICPVGRWLQLADPAARSPVDGGPERFFIEEAECVRQADGSWTWVPRPRGAPAWSDYSVNRTLGFPAD